MSIALKVIFFSYYHIANFLIIQDFFLIHLTNQIKCPLLNNAFSILLATTELLVESNSWPLNNSDLRKIEIKPLLRE